MIIHIDYSEILITLHDSLYMQPVGDYAYPVLIRHSCAKMLTWEQA